MFESILPCENKEKYQSFCFRNYVPIYSKPWWMDAICGPENWNVWLYVKGNDILAAMPFYFEERNGYKYITKAPLTQNNGIIFPEIEGQKIVTAQRFQEEVINAACDFISLCDVDVYEQQYQPSFIYWLPFFWKYYTAITRFTYTIEDTSNIQAVWENVSSKYRAKIKKGAKNTILKSGLEPTAFYQEHEKIFLKQGLPCPFSADLWSRLFSACSRNNACQILYRVTENEEIASLMFLVWDERRMYQLLAGSIPEHQNLDSYDALIWDGIQLAHEKGLMYDFEGSVIPRISKSFREFGGTPERYYRIRKVFNPDILLQEYQAEANRLQRERAIN